MPRKKTETAPVAEAKKKKPSTASKTTRSRETKEKATATKKTTAQKKPRTKKEQAPKEQKIEVVEAEVVEESNKKKKGYGVNGNLTSFSERSTNEAREAGRKGGIASGEARRKKKNLREFGRDFLMQATSPVFQSLMETHQVEQDDMTNAAALFVRLFNKAMSTGDLNAARQVVEWAGMAPLQEMRENEAVARMSQVIQLAQSDTEDEEEETSDVIIYLPDNGIKVGSPEDYGLNLTEE